MNEIVHTDQGHFPIQDLKVGEHSIRGKIIQKISKNICHHKKMVHIQKDAIQEGVPNKDTILTMNHKVSFRGRKKPIFRFLHKDGISLIPSENRPIFNVMLSDYSWMRVNNMVVETLDPSSTLS